MDERQQDNGRPGILDGASQEVPAPEQVPPPEAGATVLTLVPGGKKTRIQVGRYPIRDRADKEAVERDFRGTGLSMGELAIKHKVPKATISRWAAGDPKKGVPPWVRTNFKAMVENHVTAILAVGKADKPLETKARDVARIAADVVRQTAEINADVILGHRKDVKGLRELAMRLAHELHSATMTQEQLSDFFDQITGIKTPEGEPNPDMPSIQKAALRARFMEFMRLHSRIQSMSKLADAFAKLQAMDRLAHDLDKEQAKPLAAIPDITTIEPEQAHEAYKKVVNGG